MLIDSHCHLDRLDLSPYDGSLAAALEAARQRGVTEMLCIGIDLGNARTVIDIAEQHDGVYATVGVHPLDIIVDGDNAGDGLADMAELRLLASHKKVLAIGETGLDYHYTPETAGLQKQSFQWHLQLAAALHKPVVVHSREAQQDTLQLIAEYVAGDNAGGVLHCFTESWEMARQALDMGFYISFSGIITFRNAESLREVVRKVPLDRLLVETDSPYLAPVPYRGKKNEPKYVVEVAECVAVLKGIAFEEVSEVTANNFRNLFFCKR